MADSAETPQPSAPEGDSSKAAASLAAVGAAAARRAKEKGGAGASEFCAEGHNEGGGPAATPVEKKGPMAGAKQVMNIDNAELMAKLRNRKDRTDGD